MRKASQHTQESPSIGAVLSIERALDLLECLARSSNWVGISELSQATGQPVGTIHRLLMTLVAREYVVRDSHTRRYRLGPAFRRLAGADVQTPDWIKIATPHLRELVEISAEEATITDFGQLLLELEAIRQQGYAVDNGEQEEGVRCLAVPVYGPQGKVVAAVSISGPSSRLDSRRIPMLLPHIKRISAAISSTLAASQENDGSDRHIAG